MATIKKEPECQIFEFQQQLEYLPDGVEGLIKILDEDPNVKEYALCVHDKDEGKPPHVHVFGRLHKRRTLTSIAKMFNVRRECIRRIKWGFAHALCYMTHANRNAREDGKYLYDDDEVVSNFPWRIERDKALIKDQERMDKKKVLRMLTIGAIRQCDLLDHITPEEKLNIGKKSISSAAEIFADSRGYDCNQETILILGESGVGKSCYAHAIAEELSGGKYYVSGAENDIWEFYEDEPVVVLDDFRPSLMSYTEFLRLADPHKASPVRSRYHSKRPVLDYLIITTILTLEEFLAGFRQSDGEDPRQIMRRIKKIVELSPGKMVVTEFDDGKAVSQKEESFDVKDYWTH